MSKVKSKFLQVVTASRRRAWDRSCVPQSLAVTLPESADDTVVVMDDTSVDEVAQEVFADDTTVEYPLVGEEQEEADEVESEQQEKKRRTRSSRFADDTTVEYPLVGEEQEEADEVESEQQEKKRRTRSSRHCKSMMSKNICIIGKKQKSVNQIMLNVKLCIVTTQFNI